MRGDPGDRPRPQAERGYLHRLDDPATLSRFVRELAEGIYITNARGEVLDGNPALLKILGFPSLAALAEVSVAALWVDPAERSREAELLAREGRVREFECALRRPDGEVRTLLDSCYQVTDPTSGEVLYHGILVDITPRKELERQLFESSRRDALTGCLNRRFLGQFAARYEPTAAGWGVVAIDLDRFKEINDRLGHEAGDQALCRTVSFLAGTIREEDHLVRLGGDEFVVLLAGRDAAGTEEVAARVERGDGLEPGLSVGWAVREAGEPLERTLARADRALLAGRAARRVAPAR